MNRKEYLLTKLIEELSETIKDASKCLIFWVDDVSPVDNSPMTNQEKMQNELYES